MALAILTDFVIVKTNEAVKQEQTGPAMTATYFGQSIQGKLNISPLCYLSMDNVPSNKQAEELGAASRTSVSVPSLNPASTSHLTITFELSAPTALEENSSAVAWKLTPINASMGAEVQSNTFSAYGQTLASLPVPVLATSSEEGHGPGVEEAVPGFGQQCRAMIASASRCLLGPAKQALGDICLQPSDPEVPSASQAGAPPQPQAMKNDALLLTVSASERLSLRYPGHSMATVQSQSARILPAAESLPSDTMTAWGRSYDTVARPGSESSRMGNDPGMILLVLGQPPLQQASVGKVAPEERMAQQAELQQQQGPRKPICRIDWHQKKARTTSTAADPSSHNITACEPRDIQRIESTESVKAEGSSLSTTSSARDGGSSSLQTSQKVAPPPAQQKPPTRPSQVSQPNTSTSTRNIVTPKEPAPRNGYASQHKSHDETQGDHGEGQNRCQVSASLPQNPENRGGDIRAPGVQMLQSRHQASASYAMPNALPDQVHARSADSHVARGSRPNPCANAMTTAMGGGAAYSGLPVNTTATSFPMVYNEAREGRNSENYGNTYLDNNHSHYYANYRQGGGGTYSGYPGAGGAYSGYSGAGGTYSGHQGRGTYGGQKGAGTYSRASYGLGRELSSSEALQYERREEPYPSRSRYYHSDDDDDIAEGSVEEVKSLPPNYSHSSGLGGNYKSYHRTSELYDRQEYSQATGHSQSTHYYQQEQYFQKNNTEEKWAGRYEERHTQHYEQNRGGNAHYSRLEYTERVEYQGSRSQHQSSVQASKNSTYSRSDIGAGYTRDDRCVGVYGSGVGPEDGSRFSGESSSSEDCGSYHDGGGGRDENSKGDSDGGYESSGDDYGDADDYSDDGGDYNDGGGYDDGGYYDDDY
ncbi:hypothetical protein HDV57DRAFT_524747 [Trichoderma longibrachiatum]